MLPQALETDLLGASPSTMFQTLFLRNTYTITRFISAKLKYKKKAFQRANERYKKKKGRHTFLQTQLRAVSSGT